ncbi:MAG: hypothetical protein K2X86_18855 [Cytophagaceae bacterium]|nr:hypothetical protein [Cytophagaceae bacterium]
MIKKIFNQVSVLIGIIFLVGIYKSVISTSEIHLKDTINQVGIGSLLLSSAFYLFSHFLRSLRIAVMAGREDISLRKVVKTQFYTNGINLILPFKFGEIIRLWDFHKLIKKYEVSVSTILAEKFIDLCFLFFGLSISLLIVDTSKLDLDFTIISCMGFILVVLFFYFIIPNNIKSFNLFIAKRYSHPYVIRVLAFTSKLYRIIKNMQEIFTQKTATLLVFTLLIWSFEVLAFFFLFDFLSGYKLILLLAFLVFLSVFIPSGSLGFGGVQLGFYCISLINADFKFLELSLIYQIFLFLPAIFISFSIFLNDRYVARQEAMKKLVAKIKMQRSRPVIEDRGLKGAVYTKTTKAV